MAQTDIVEGLDNLPRIKFYDRMMTTINPEAEISGPIFINREQEKSQYAQELMKIILEEAHKKAIRYYNAEDYQAYYSFLVLALTVPLQEGLYMHFREVHDTTTLCNQHASIGNILFAPTPEKLEEKYEPAVLEEKKASSSVYKHFQLALKNPERPLFPDCTNFEATNGPIRQVVRGYDGSDMGMMQLSIRWHYDEFYSQKGIQSVRKTIRYGLNHLMNGFRPVLANQKNYKCLRKGWFLFKKKELSYENLIRGVWAGKYNSGSIKKTCRFADINSKYKAHDTGFSKNLDKVLAYDENRIIGASETLGFKVNDQTHAVLKEVITNFKKKTNNRESIDSFIGLN